LSEPLLAEADVLVIGAGAAGMYAAVEAARAGCNVLLADRSLIGRGGATVMAQMTVAAAISEEIPDHWSHHYADTMAAGRGLCDEPLARLLCEEAPECIREMDEWGVGWARRDGHIAQVAAPGHDRPRCVYVDFLDTGPAVSKTLRSVINRAGAIRKAGDLCIIDLVRVDGAVVGAVALHLGSGMPAVITAKATIIATGGLTRLYRRNSASTNMGGDGYALALRAGASVINMEFVQFFPIGHLAPRLIGMDPIMWDPFRYKLGGRLLNSKGEEFSGRYGIAEDGAYLQTRDVATLAILKEVEAGRGSPHGGVYLSFVHCSEAALREAFGPIIDRLAANHIDLSRMMIEVAPIAHYHMGGIVADARMATAVPGLFAAGEAVGGANGANRLSGNAVTEALVFGRRAGRSAAEHARRVALPTIGRAETSYAIDLITADAPELDNFNTAAGIEALQGAMAEDVGPLRDAPRLRRALATIADLAAALGERPCGEAAAFEMRRLEWLDLRNMLVVARAVATAALMRAESRGAHQREDFPETLPEARHRLRVRLEDGHIQVSPQ
jgi:succinate dehydrogenase/fumarate reductase flavoprotein subunit